MDLRDLLRGGPLNHPTSPAPGDHDIPARYDAHLVPVLFGPWADALVARLSPAPGIRALDVATGPGTVARRLAAAIGPGGQVIGADLSPSMIAWAASKPTVEGGAPLAWMVAPAAPLPWPDAAFDLVTCQQGLQFVPDAAAALTEISRVLKPGGRVAVSVWGPPETCPAFDAFQQALTASGLPDLAALMRIPFPRWTGDDLAARARELGFGYLRTSTETRDVTFAGGVDQAVQALHATPIGPMLAALDQDLQAAILEDTRHRLAPWTRDGVLTAPMTASLLLATA